MIRLFKYEIYKLFSSKEIVVGVMLCLFVYALYVHSTIPSYHNNYRSAYEYYKRNEGVVTSQNILIAKKGKVELNIKYNQGIRFNNEELGRSLLYRDIDKVIKERTNYNKLIKELQSYKNEKEKLTYNIIKKVGPIDGAYYTEGWKSIIGFWGDIDYYFVAILTLLGISKIFPNELAAGMAKLIKSTKEGNRKLNIAKIATAIFYIITLTVIFSLINILVNAFIYGLPGWNVPLKNIFIQTPYNIKIYQFWILQQLIAVMAISILGLLTMLISIFTKKSVVSFSIMGTGFLVYDILTKAEINSQVYGSAGFVITNFISLKRFCTSYLNVYNLFGITMTYESVMFSMCFILFIVMILITYFSCKKFN